MTSPLMAGNPTETVASNFAGNVHYGSGEGCWTWVDSCAKEQSRGKAGG